MPFKRKFKRTFRKKRSFRRKSLKKKVARVTKTVRRWQAAEMHWSYNTVSGAAAPIVSTHNSVGSGSANGIVLLSGIAAGDGSMERTGDRIQMKKLFIRGHTYTNVATSTSPSSITNIGRIIIYLIKFTNGTTYDASTWLEGWSTGTSSNVLALQSTKRREDVKILFDKKISLARYSDTTAVVHHSGVWSIRLNLSKLIKGVTTYNGTAATVADTRNNHVFIQFMQSNPLTSDQGSLVTEWMYKLSYLP